MCSWKTFGRWRATVGIPYTPPRNPHIFTGTLPQLVFALLLNCPIWKCLLRITLGHWHCLPVERTGIAWKFISSSIPILTLPTPDSQPMTDRLIWGYKSPAPLLGKQSGVLHTSFGLAKSGRSPDLTSLLGGHIPCPSFYSSTSQGFLFTAYS